MFFNKRDPKLLQQEPYKGAEKDSRVKFSKETVTGAQEAKMGSMMVNRLLTISLGQSSCCLRSETKAEAAMMKLESGFGGS